MRRMCASESTDTEKTHRAGACLRIEAVLCFPFVRMGQNGKLRLEQTPQMAGGSARPRWDKRGEKHVEQPKSTIKSRMNDIHVGGLPLWLYLLALVLLAAALWMDCLPRNIVGA